MRGLFVLQVRDDRNVPQPKPLYAAFFTSERRIMKARFLFLLAVAFGCVVAQAAGVDLQAFALAHADVLAGLSAMGFAGAIKTQFTDLYFLDPEGETVVEVGCVTTIGGLTAARDQIETTCLNDVGRTYEAGMPTPGAATFTINFDPSDDSHVRLQELYREGTKIDWALGWGDYNAPRGPGLGPLPTVSSGGLTGPGTRTWIFFNGYVSDLPFDFALNSVVTSNVAVQVSDFPVLVPKA